MTDPSREDRGGLELRLDRRRSLLTLALALLLVLGTASLIGHASDVDELLDAVRDADGRWFPLCLAGIVAAYVGYVMLYREVSAHDDGPVLPVWTATRVVALGFGATVLGSAAGSLAVDFWALRRAGESTHAAARRVLALNTLEWLMLGGGAAVAGAVALTGMIDAPVPMSLGWLVCAPVLTGIGLLAVRNRRIAPDAVETSERPEVSLREPRTWRPWVVYAARRGLGDALDGCVIVRAMAFRPKRYIRGLIGCATYWAGHFVCLGAALHAFGERPRVAAVVLAFATGYVASSLPLPAGGAGGIEAALAFSLNAVGVDLAIAVLAVLVYRGFTFWLPLAPAFVVLPRLTSVASALDAVRGRRLALRENG